MRYAQVKSGQKLHLVFELHNESLTNPICGRKVEGYRMTINLPLGNACKNCQKRANSKSFSINQFIRKYYD